MDIQDRFWVWRHIHNLTWPRLSERFLIWLAWKLPRRLVLWCFTRVAAHATMGEYGNETPDDVSVIEAMNRWNKN